MNNLFFIAGTKMNTNNNTVDIRPYRRANQYVLVGSALGRLAMKIKLAMVRRQAIRELSALSDAQLNDIGIPRYAIREAVESNLAHLPYESSVESITPKDRPKVKGATNIAAITELAA